MLHYIREYQKYVEITGFRGINIQDTDEIIRLLLKEKKQDIVVQFFNADLVATWEHLYFAVLNVFLSYRNKRNISRTVAMEALIYASAQRQIRKAIALLGVKQSSSNVAVIIIGRKPEIIQAALVEIRNRIAATADETVLEMSEEKNQEVCSAFRITEEELEAASSESYREKAIVNIVIEKMALMQTQL